MLAQHSGRNINFNFVEDADLYDQVSDCMINGGVVGWMSGRAEFGPRALGARSILADPRDPQMQKNSLTKSILHS